MTGVLGLRTRAAWRRRWPSFLAIAILFGLTLGATITAAAGARRTQSAPARFLREDGTFDVLVSMQPINSFRGVKEIAALPQVRSISANVGVAAFPVGNYTSLLAPVDGTGGITVYRGVLQAGRRPDPDADDEIMLSEASARTFDARIGDRIRLVAFDEAQTKRCLYADNQPADCAPLFRKPKLAVRVVGITRTANDVNNRSGDFSISVLSGRFFERHRADLGWNPLLFVQLRPGVSTASFVAAARRVLPRGGEAEFDLANAAASFDAVGVLSTGLTLFALVAGLAGAFAVGQAIVRQVRADDEERAVLATLGATRRVVLVDALAPVAIAALLGCFAALLVSYVASEWMPIGFARRLDPSRGRELDWLVVAAGIGVDLIVVGVSVTLTVRSSRRVVTQRSRRASLALATVGAASASAAVGLRNAASPGRGRRAVPVRSAFVGVAAAAAGIVGVLGFSGGLAHLVDTPRLYGWTFDLMGVDSSYTARVTSDPGVGAVADLRTGVPLRVNGRPTLGQMVAPIVGDIAPAIVTGRAPVANDEIALGLDSLHAARAHLGGTVAVAGAKGKLAMRVVGRAVFPTGTDAYPLADGAILAPRSLATLGDGDSSHSLAIRYRPGADRAATYARLDALDARTQPDASPPDRPRPPAEIEKLRQVESLPKVLAGFLALLGAVALAHALVVGVRRRARDFAVLRALGFRRRDVRAAVSWEAGALALAGAVIGVPAGLVIARIAWARTADGIGVMAVHRIPAGAILVIVPAAVVLAIAIALLPARRAANSPPSEILRDE